MRKPKTHHESLPHPISDRKPSRTAHPWRDVDCNKCHRTGNPLWQKKK
jgi:hypothetical protein